MKWIKASVILLAVTFIAGCKREPESTVQLIRTLKHLAKEKTAALDFGSDTVYTKKLHLEVAAKNTGRIPLNVAAIVPSCTCTKAAFDKKRIQPGDSLKLEVRLKENTAGAAITIVGNLPGGQKTIYIKVL